MRTLAACVVAVSAVLATAAPAVAAGEPGIAALQVALRSRGLYKGPVDGVRGPATTAAVIALQRRAGLPPDGVAGPQTRRALGPLGRPRLGTRELRSGLSGWDVAALQFALAWRGFPSGPVDGAFGPRLDAAVRRFQRSAGVAADGRVGSATLAALAARRARIGVRLSAPVAAPITERFGPRGDRFHAGVDFPAGAGTAVLAAAPGRVVYAGWRPGGFGRVVMLAHGGGVRTLYAHLARVDVRLGARVERGMRIGLVGSTGRSSGPHLHFEVRLSGAAVDPAAALSTPR